jgi:hypothetical protein
MNTPTTHDVVKRLAELSRMLDRATDEYAELDEDWVRRKAEHQVGFARAFLSADGSVDARKQKAVLAMANEFLLMELAEQKVRACRERIRTIRDQIEVGRSLNSAVRAEWNAGAVGQT